MIENTQDNGASTTHTVSVTAPANNLGPQGWYMLFAIETNGLQRVPSVASLVQIL